LTNSSHFARGIPPGIGDELYNLYISFPEQMHCSGKEMYKKFNKDGRLK